MCPCSMKDCGSLKFCLCWPIFRHRWLILFRSTCRYFSSPIRNSWRRNQASGVKHQNGIDIFLILPTGPVVMIELLEIMRCNSATSPTPSAQNSINYVILFVELLKTNHRTSTICRIISHWYGGCTISAPTPTIFGRENDIAHVIICCCEAEGWHTVGGRHWSLHKA